MGGATDVSANDSAKLGDSPPKATQQRPAGGGSSGNFPDHPTWRFTFVNHGTTNPFFVTTQYGAQDACAQFNCEYQWTGSEKADVVEMVNAINAAVAANVDGIAVSVVDTSAFRDPIDRALQAGIPVVSYNADGAIGDHGSARLAYIGQDLFLSGVEMGKKLVELVNEGDIVGFIATPARSPSSRASTAPSRRSSSPASPSISCRSPPTSTRRMRSPASRPTTSATRT
jgi:simple sugar transport system substrate-binding protein